MRPETIRVIANVLFVLAGILQSALGVVILIIPFIARKKTPEKAKKLFTLLSIAAIGILALDFTLSLGYGFVSYFVGYIRNGMPFGLVIRRSFIPFFKMLSSILGVLAALAFPFLAHSKKAKPALGAVFALPVLQCILAIVHASEGGILGLRRNGFMIIEVLVLLVLIPAAVWAFTGRKRAMSLVTTILSAIALLGSLVIAVISSIGERFYYTDILAVAIYGRTGPLSARFILEPQAFLLLFLISMGLYAFLTAPKTVKVRPVQQIPQYQQAPQYPQAP